jgi:hypothetical protein
MMRLQEVRMVIQKLKIRLIDWCLVPTLAVFQLYRENYKTYNTIIWVIKNYDQLRLGYWR